ncbi:MAG: hypothetical protein J6S67_02200 [Methanobrevibacter sp.]|nr:hypothetical protein [Methanobrevibacter sp.]
MKNGYNLYSRIAHEETFAHQWNKLTDEERALWQDFDEFKTYRYMMENCAMERKDYTRIKKLMQLKDAQTFWSDVRKLTKRLESDHALNRWQCLAELRYKTLIV